jgi:MFS family permease
VIFLKKWEDHPFYRWVIVGCCFLMILVCLGFCSGTKGLFLGAVTQALELERGLYSVNDTFRYMASAVMNLFFGALVLRFGARKLIGVGFLSLAASVLLYAWAQTLPMIYLSGLLMGVGQGFTSTSMVGYVVGIWCRENKGTVMGAVLAANGVGSAVAAQVVGPLINASTFGYRDAYGLTALILLAAGVLVVGLFRDRSAGDQLPAAKKSSAGWQGITLKEGLRRPWFYAVALYVFVMGLVIQSLAGIFPAHMKDVGLDPDYVTLVLSVYSLLLTGTKFLTGISYDRLGLSRTMMICNGATILACLLLSVLGADSAAVAMAFGVVFAIGVPIQTVGMPLLTADLFGARDQARIMGVLMAISTAGYAVGTPLVNVFYDLQGTYLTALLVMAAMMAVATAAIVLTEKTVKKLKTHSAQEAE